MLTERQVDAAVTGILLAQLCDELKKKTDDKKKLASKKFLDLYCLCLDLS